MPLITCGFGSQNNKRDLGKPVGMINDAQALEY